MINMEYTQEMTDAIHGLIAYSGIEQAVIDTSIFNRLHRVLQSSLVYLTYPSNKVKRFEHSVGTMHLAGKLFFHSVCNSPQRTLDRFFGEVRDELISWNEDPKSGEVAHILDAVRNRYKGKKIGTIPWPRCRLYIENTPENLKSTQKLSYYVVFQAIRLAGLLHDVGHLPYSHVLENALQSLYQKVKQLPEKKRDEAHEYFLEVMGPYCGRSDPDYAIHEQLGERFVDKIFKSITDDLPKRENDYYFFLAAVFYFTKRILTAREGEKNLFSDLHRIVAGTLDCDRMDYCCRDGYFAGTSKELPNYGNIFSSISMVYRPPEKGTEKSEGGRAVPSKDSTDGRKRCYFAPSAKALREIEALLRRRWNIYVSINYHHRVHKHELLFQEVLAELGLKEMNDEREKKKKKDSDSSRELENPLPLSVSSIWKLVAQMSTNTPVEYLAIQLDDSWLDTLLKHSFFDLYKEEYLSFATYGNKVTWHRLDELISVKKHYRSLIKHSDGFQQFDEYVYHYICKSDKSGDFLFLDVHPRMPHSAYVKKYGEYLFNRVVRFITLDKALRIEFFGSLSYRAQKLVASKKNPYHVMDCILADCSFSMGINPSDSLYITAPNQDEKPFLHYSALYSTLSGEKKLLPSIHIYYLPQYDTESSQYCRVNKEDFLRAIAEETGKVIMEFFGSHPEISRFLQQDKAMASIPDRAGDPRRKTTKKRGKRG